MMLASFANVCKLVPLLAADGVVSARHFRFTALGLKSGALLFSPGVTALGLAFNGCPDVLSGHESKSSVNGTVLTLDFGQPVAMNGWWLQVTGPCMLTMYALMKLI